jgi:hypothetical protein
LPFDADTDARDQSNSRGWDPRHLSEFVQDGAVEVELLDQLSRGAQRLRGFIRVKIADDNDLAQARETLVLVKEAVRELCAAHSDPDTVLRSLLGRG